MAPPPIEDFHHRFRASMEAAKWCKRGEAACGALALAVALLSVLLPEDVHLRRYLPLAAAAVAVGVFSARTRAQTLRGFGERCRRLTIRAYGGGEALPKKALSDAIEDTPALTEWRSKRLPRQSIEQYYASKLPAGPARLREMYAESAYFSSRLLRAYAMIAGIAAALLAALSTVCLYAAAIEFASSPGTLDRVLEIVASVVFGAIVLTLLERWIDARSAARSIREIEDRLLECAPSELDRPELHALMRDYDAEQLAAPLIPTWLHRARYRRLDRAWARRRELCWPAARRAESLP